MKYAFFLTLILFSLAKARSQQVDTLYFNLYTDSLKKGTYNYINVDGKLSNSKWLPLTEKEISLTASAGTFNGNSLFIDSNFAEEKVTVKVLLKANPAVSKEITIYIKKMVDNERLKTSEEVMHPPRRRKTG